DVERRTRSLDDVDPPGIGAGQEAGLAARVRERRLNEPRGVADLPGQPPRTQERLPLLGHPDVTLRDTEPDEEPASSLVVRGRQLAEEIEGLLEPADGLVGSEHVEGPL